MQLAVVVSFRKRAHPGHTPLGGLMISKMIFTLLIRLSAIALFGRLVGTDARFGIARVEDAHEARITGLLRAP